MAYDRVVAGIVSYCFFCGAAGPAGASCPSCLVTIPRPAPETTAAFACPRCSAQTPLMPIGIASSATIHACPVCHGILVGARAWCTIVQRPELARQIASKLPARDAKPAELVRMLRCPTCTREMERGRFGASSPIVIDVCVAHGSWLDSGEVVAIADHAALRARVGVAAARRATDAAEAHLYDPTRVSDEAEAAMRAATVAARMKTAKRGGLIFLLAMLALRIAFFFFGRSGTVAPPAIGQAGEAAGSAATALGNR